VKEPAYPDILSPRLRLVWMSPAFMEAAVEGDRATAEHLIGVELPAEWPDESAQRVMQMRLRQIEKEPASASWLLRLMVDGSATAVGFVNFHGRPVEGRAELGYTVFAPYRRMGYASEAAIAMMRWARDQHGVETFVVSISPSNAPSLAMAERLGFERVGTQMDEIDGEEWVFELGASSLPDGA
jgi:RimJ/RimL family protein N-acetyltransferase